ncbi:hypothetical protein IFM89_034372 [Coptis chinensis]|uniref:Uncharacterized protein n=1 Tax=Coptis chinensis TaxID=261450 RepID=A0A835H8E0_9MAGN|nr:hypothetical protein IFM89_034372 [Coptis chinensis]
MEASESCYNTIRDAVWFEIDRVGAEPGELKGAIEIVFSALAQYDAPPDYPVNKVCDAIDGLPEGSDTLSRISAGYSAGVSLLDGDGPCNNVFANNPPKNFGWTWQKYDSDSILNGFEDMY